MGIKKSENLNRRQIVVSVNDALQLGEEYAISYLPDLLSRTVQCMEEDGVVSNRDVGLVTDTLFDILKDAFAKAVLLYTVYDSLTYDDSHHEILLDKLFASVCAELTSCIDLSEDDDRIALITDQLPLNIATLSEYDGVCEQLAVAMLEEIDSLDLVNDPRYEEYACDIREDILSTMGREIDPDDEIMINASRATISIFPEPLFRRLH